MAGGVGDRPVVVVFAFADVQNLSAGPGRFLNGRRDTPHGPGTQNKIDALDLLEKRFTLELGNAAHNANHRFDAVGLTPNLANACIKLVLGFLSNGTSVKNNNL